MVGCEHRSGAIDGSVKDMCLDKTIYFDSRCTENPAIPSAELEYRFFVAGHTYGKPGVDSIGFHPPFREEIPRIKNQKEIEFGVLTGDIVFVPSDADWNEIDQDIKTLEIPVYFAVGNHDVGKDPQRKLYESRYGKTYFTFSRNNDLFIILDPNLDHWNIAGDQLSFLKETLKGAAQARNIFVFFHQVLWWDENGEFASVKINSKANRSPEPNFWKTVFPLFSMLSSNVYMFSGDVGAFPTGHEFHYYRDKKIHFIASGMGGGKRDAYIVVSVGEKATTITLKHLG